MEFDLDQLKKDEEAAQRQKGIYGALGAITQGFDAVPSANELLYGGKSYRPNNKAVFDDLQKGVEDPLAKKKKEFEANDMANSVARENQSKDPNSREAVMARAWMKQNGFDVQDNDTMQSLESTYGKIPDLVKEKLKSQTEFGNQMALKKMDYGQQSREKALDRKAELERERLKLAKEKTPNAEAYKAATFAMRTKDANKTLNDLYSSGDYDQTGAGAAIQRSGLFPEAFKSQSAKKADQAERNFVNAVLRKESGSAIADSEFDSAAKQYFPRIGDTDEILAQKARNRAMAIAGLEAEGKNAIPDMQDKFQQMPNFNAGVHTGKKSGLIDKALSSMGIADANASAGVDPDAVKYSQIHNIPLEKAAKIIATRKAQYGR